MRGAAAEGCRLRLVAEQSCHRPGWDSATWHRESRGSLLPRVGNAEGRACEEGPAWRPGRRELYSWKMKTLWGIHANALAYSMTTLGAGMMNSIFNFYYVKLFLNRYKISETGFHVAQVHSRQLPAEVLRAAPVLHSVRSPSVRPGLPAALVPLEALRGGRLAEQPAPHRRAVRLRRAADLRAAGAVRALRRELQQARQQAPAHQVQPGKYSTSQYEQREIRTEDANLENGDGAFSLASVVSLTKQIMTEKNFLCFVTMNFFQVFHLAFYNNFMMIFADNLIPKDVLSSSVRSIMYGAGFICPQCLVLLSHAFLKKFGYYRIILFSFYYEGVAAAVMCLLGQEHYYLLAFYVTTNMVIVQASFSLFNLPLADIVDADLIKHKRRLPLSSMVFGTNALFTKPAQSLAPMVVVTILNHYGYYNLNNVPGHPDMSRSFLDLHDAMFYLVCLVPLCIAVLQILTWTPFSIQNSHLAAPQ
ncbi:transmembrane protein 180-like isoform X4 [Haemorhous mexicanus]|uniref:transmembrane protein 180-like isoform X4 n=1 Tax=Haemorhous mexicanus TaxID=30427 RepID=UPI0028BDEF95|nr:transmembrane protein 180-like isoform X4 [Haemorhous mexicanus]